MVNLNNFFKIISDKGLNAKKLSDATGISTRNISDWKNGRSMPSAIKLDILANYLDCSVDYLLGRTDSPEHVNISQGNYVNGAGNTIAQNYGQGTQTVREAAPSSSLSDECSELVRIYTALPFRQRVELLNVAIRLEGEASAG